MTHASRKWKAVELAAFVDPAHTLTVTGERQFHDCGQTVRLSEGCPQGIGPVTLLLHAAVSVAGNIRKLAPSWRSPSERARLDAILGKPQAT